MTALHTLSLCFPLRTLLGFFVLFLKTDLVDEEELRATLNCSFINSYKSLEQH